MNSVSGRLVDLGRRALFLAGRWLITLLLRANRLVIRGEEHMTEALVAGRPVFVGLWHQRLLYPLWYMRRFRPAVLVSQSSDGDLMAGLLESWGYRTLRGSSTRGSRGSLRAMMRDLDESDTLLVNAMDGPLGPVRVAKAGGVALAAKKEAVLIPIAGVATRQWTFKKSWDRFQIPKPFGRIVVQCGPPVAVVPGLEDEEIARLLGEQIDRVAAEADDLATHVD